MISSREEVDYYSPEGIEAWVQRCQFRVYPEAVAALKVNERTFFRWKAQGLPKGWAGETIARRMRAVELARARQRRKQT